MYAPRCICAVSVGSGKTHCFTIDGNKYDSVSFIVHRGQHFVILIKSRIDWLLVDDQVNHNIWVDISEYNIAFVIFLRRNM